MPDKSVELAELYLTTKAGAPPRRNRRRDPASPVQGVIGSRTEADGRPRAGSNLKEFVRDVYASMMYDLDTRVTPTRACGGNVADWGHAGGGTERAFIEPEILKTPRATTLVAASPAQGYRLYLGDITRRRAQRSRTGKNDSPGAVLASAPSEFSRSPRTPISRIPRSRE